MAQHRGCPHVEEYSCKVCPECATKMGQTVAVAVDQMYDTKSRQIIELSQASLALTAKSVLEDFYLYRPCQPTKEGWWWELAARLKAAWQLRYRASGYELEIVISDKSEHGYYLLVGLTTIFSTYRLAIRYKEPGIILIEER